VSWPEVVSSTELIVLFGGASLKNAQIEAGGAVIHDSADYFKRAGGARLEFVNISASRQDLPPELNAQWIPIRPNTDVALMLGLAHTLATEGLHDRQFLSKYCEGYERFEGQERFHHPQRLSRASRQDSWSSRLEHLGGKDSIRSKAS
jgi:biotin/methionine sulfoxide reductase